MAKTYDIVNRLTNERPKIKLAKGKEYEVNTSKNAAIVLKALAEDDKMDEFERMDKIVELALGKKALDQIESMNLTVASYTVIISAIMAAVSDKELSEVEEEVEKQQKSFCKRK